MTFLESIKHCFSNYGNFKGRGKRSEYWYFQLFAFIVFFHSNVVIPVFVHCCDFGIVYTNTRSWYSEASRRRAIRLEPSLGFRAVWRVFYTFLAG